MSFIKGIKRKMSFSSSARTKSSSSESEELEKLGITRRSSIAQQDSLISYQDCILRYYQFMGCNVKKVKKLIPRGWSKVKGVDHATIGQVNQLVFKIFYLKSDSSLFVPKNEFDKEETYLILSGTCAVQLGDEVRRYTQGDFIHVPSNIVHGVTTAKKEEVVVGYVHSKTKDNLSIQDLKYSKEKRRSSLIETPAFANPAVKNQMGSSSSVEPGPTAQETAVGMVCDTFMRHMSSPVTQPRAAPPVQYLNTIDPSHYAPYQPLKRASITNTAELVDYAELAFRRGSI